MSNTAVLTAETMQWLFEGKCVLSFRFEDGSVVESVVTLNQDILDMYGLGRIDGIVDLQERRSIPEAMFEQLAEIRRGEDKCLSQLDEFFEIGGKISW